MSKKSGRRGNSHVIRSDSELTPSVRAAKRRVYAFLCAGLLVIPLGLSSIPGMSNASYYMTVMVAFGLCVCLLWAVWKKAIEFVYTPFFLALAVWLGVKLLTTFTSTHQYASFWGTYGYWSDGFMYGLAIAVIAAVVVTLRLDNRRIARLISLVTAEAVIFAAITIGQAIAEGFFYQKVRPNSPLENADFFLSYSLLFLPLLVVMCVVDIRRRNWGRLVVSGIGSLIMLGAVFVSMPTHLQTILLPVFENGKVDSTAGANDIKSISAGNFTSDTANTERWSEWKYGLQFGMSRPLVGTGPSTTNQAFQAAESHHQINMREWNNGVEMNRSHNDLIEQFSEEGLLGLAAYLVLWAVFIFIVIKHSRKIDPQMRPYAIGLGLGLLVWFGFNQLLFTTVVSGVVVMVWVALLLTMVGSTRIISGRALMISLGAFTVVLGFASVWLGIYWVNDTAVDNAILSVNRLSSGQSSNVSWNDVVAQTTAAANAMPYEPHYNEMAAVVSLEAYPNTKDVAYQKSLGLESLRYAHKMLAENPYSTEYMSVLATVEYAVAPAGSAEEQSGLDEMNRAISITPRDGGLYLTAAQNGAAKKDYRVAREYIAEGLAAPLKPAEKQKLTKLEASLPV